MCYFSSFICCFHDLALITFLFILFYSFEKCFFYYFVIFILCYCYKTGFGSKMDYCSVFWTHWPFFALLRFVNFCYNVEFIWKWILLGFDIIHKILCVWLFLPMSGYVAWISHENYSTPVGLNFVTCVKVMPISIFVKLSYQYCRHFYMASVDFMLRWFRPIYKHMMAYSIRLFYIQNCHLFLF